MRKGFTLLELIVVIIIIGVLATLGVQQYGRVIEKSRAAEAKSILGDIRKTAAGYYMEKDSLTGFTSTMAGIGTGAGLIPDTCSGQSSHYFNYTTSVTATALTATANRCTTGGKSPAYASGGTVVLTSTLSTGADTWSTTGPY